MPLTLETATGLAAAAIAHGRELGAPVGAVVLDAGGHILCAQRDERAFRTALTIAERKAFTALNFGVPTHAMMRDRMRTVERAIQVTLADPRLAFLMGGLPLVRAGETVGALGVSGGTGDEDLACGRAALAALGFDALADA